MLTMVLDIFLADSTDATGFGDVPPKLWVMIFAVSTCMSLFCILQIHLKHQAYPWAHRVLWSLLALVPFLGPVFYGALFKRMKREDGCTEYPAGLGADRHHGSFAGSDSGGGDGGGGDD